MSAVLAADILFHRRIGTRRHLADAQTRDLPQLPDTSRELFEPAGHLMAFRILPVPCFGERIFSRHMPVFCIVIDRMLCHLFLTFRAVMLTQKEPPL